MKEAAGEANLTVITIVLIGVVAAVGVILIPRLMNGVQDKSCCQELGGYISAGYCKGIDQNYQASPNGFVSLGGIRSQCQ